MTTQHTPITPATINGQSYFRVPLPSGMCAFVKFEEEANKLQAICNAHEELLEALKDMLAAYEVQDPFNSRGGIDFEGRYIGSDEKGQILLMRAEAKAKAAIAKAEGK